MTTEEKRDLICKLLYEKKAVDIVSVAITHLTTLADHLIICSAKSTTQAKALFGFIDDELEKIDIFAKHKEGAKEASWIVLDYSDIIVHIFLAETRELYSLEKLWSDGHNITNFNGKD